MMATLAFVLALQAQAPQKLVPKCPTCRKPISQCSAGGKHKKPAPKPVSREDRGGAPSRNILIVNEHPFDFHYSPELPSGGGRISFSTSLVADEYDVVNLPSWGKVVEKSDYSFTVYFSANQSSQRRTGSMRVQSKGASANQSITINLRQQAKEAATTHGGGAGSSLAITGQSAVSKQLTSSGGTVTFTLASSLQGKYYLVSLLPSWCELEEKKASQFTIRYTQNTGSSSRSTEFLVTIDGEKTVVTLTQNGSN